MVKYFPNYYQPDHKDCGPTCLKIIAKHYGKTIALQQVRQLSGTTREGSSLLGLSEAAESIGFRSLGVKINLEKLEEAPLPCILHWNKNHFVVLAYLNPSKGGKFTRFVKKLFGIKNSRNEGWKVFVLIPLPGTGVYAGTIAAYIFGIERKQAFLANTIGVFISCLIIWTISVLALKGIDIDFF